MHHFWHVDGFTSSPGVLLATLVQCDGRLVLLTTFGSTSLVWDMRLHRVPSPLVTRSIKIGLAILAVHLAYWTFSWHILVHGLRYWFFMIG